MDMSKLRMKILTGVISFLITSQLYTANTNAIKVDAKPKGCTAGICSVVSVDLSNYDAEAVEMKTDIVSEEVPVNEADIELLARLVTAEMGYNQPEKYYYYCGSVVLNRVKMEKYFPNTVYEVIYQHTGEYYQYQCVKDGHIERDYDLVAYGVAADLLKSGSILPETVIYQDTSPHGSETYEILGTTYFCYI